MIRLLTVTALLLSLFACLTPIDVLPDAKGFANRKGFDPKTVECVNMDSDGDGYVSCSASNPSGALIAYECHKFGHGCRPTVERD